MVEGAALEKRCAGNGTEGSNPSLSAKRAKTIRPALSRPFFIALAGAGCLGQFPGACLQAAAL